MARTTQSKEDKDNRFYLRISDYFIDLYCIVEILRMLFREDKERERRGKLYDYEAIDQALENYSHTLDKVVTTFYSLVGEASPKVLRIAIPIKKEDFLQTEDLRELLENSENVVSFINKGHHILQSWLCELKNLKTVLSN